ncbi:hypothetical protein [Paradevosia shaoguanensis]|uniref:CoxF protein n=1 Tax=Paradevosia shaoguanensis TaxID=1335043 RepID=A0AA41QKE4_9HYPH|nr:hypothetical protein [Paradevosia shaoguanensis]MCF1741630.1 hypothetical protein [Paradevosia shaoguanensis]MCI0126113.1 hypothetical protein [Paradevosia shaoguanensis]CDP51606.1 hypothetical protein [Devosia sp. DBB001]
MAKEVTPLTPEQLEMARRRKRAVALGVVLGLVVVLFYVLTVFKMGPAIFNRDL